jgi:hypothetical protein
VVSVVHLPPGCTIDAALITHGLAADWSDPSAFAAARGARMVQCALAACTAYLHPSACVLTGAALPASPPPPCLCRVCSPADWQPPQGSLPEGPARHPRTWLMLSDRHAHVDDVLQEVGGDLECVCVCVRMCVLV